MTRPTRLSPAVLAAIAAAAATASNPLHAQQPAATGDPQPEVLEITTVDYAFRAPDRAAPGWTRIRFVNEGEEPHFVFMSRLPEDRTVEDYERDLSGVYARAWYALRDGDATEEEALNTIVDGMPGWYSELAMIGGPGMLSPGLVSEVLLELEPGTYVLECYLKNADGEIHYMDGMIRELEVAGAPASVTLPEPDVRVTLSNDDMRMDGEVTAGRRVFQVFVQENPEAGFGHSAHLARLAPGVSADDVVPWLNWLALDGMRNPAPAVFLGGLHPMPAGTTGYFIADLEPGRYLLVSEATGHTGVLHEFTVR